MDEGSPRRLATLVVFAREMEAVLTDANSREIRFHSAPIRQRVIGRRFRLCR